MAFDLNDAWGWIQKLISRVSRLESGAMLENSSITNGRMRFIGGLLLIDSGGTLTVVGHLNGQGDFVWDGPWALKGPGEITGDVDITGDLALLDDGRFTSANVRIEGGKIYVGAVGSQVVIDGATGSITVPGSHPIVMRQASGLARIDLGSTGRIWSGGDGVTIAHGGGATAAINVYSDGIDLLGDLHLSSKDPLPTGVSGRYLILGNDGQVYVGSAGGGGGNPGDPPAGNPDGYIWPADPAVYGISDNFAAHVARGSAEPGVDVMTPVGTPIWAPADGTIVAVQSSPSGATGRYITLVTDEGDWFRFLHASAVAVTVNQTVSQTDLLGYTGGSGFGSEAYYGPHLHVSFSVGYTGSFPGASAMNDFEAYMAAA